MFSLDYHETTKHHFNRFARSSGYLDWSTQPDPFRRFHGAPLIELPRTAVSPDVPYDALFEGGIEPAQINPQTVGDFLRCSMGLSAWKQYQTSRWALRVNPSSGNLHPTETYLVWGGRLSHYAPREHAIEERCLFDVHAAASWQATPGARSDELLVGLTSIFWREAWKYGERAFRYCQHDLGHAIGALRFAAAGLGWRMALLPRWSDAQIAALLGLDRDGDFEDAEREAPECLAILTRGDPAAAVALEPVSLVDAVQRGAWTGRANRLSRAHVDWRVIDRIADATDYPGEQGSEVRGFGGAEVRRSGGAEACRAEAAERRRQVQGTAELSARSVILRRRSAVAFDAHSALPAATFLSMLDRLRPGSSPWDAIDWVPEVHLALFVHRVDGVAPGIYAFLRDTAVFDDWRASMRPDFLWERVSTDLFLLLPMDVKWPAMRVSCDQDIAGDGFFSLGMIARLEPSLRARGEWFYRRLYWECGLIGQVLYLESEAAGARSTGIGCFYDDAVHEVLGLAGPRWQSLYHFSMGVPVEDTRLTTEPGYAWESSG